MTVPGDTTIARNPADTTTTTLSAEAKRAKNFLLTASDSRACIDPNSPYAAAFGTDDIGARADTIMLLRVDPGTNQAAILSFPRDLWVKIPGKGNSRINSALDVNNPQRLIDTIAQNFYLPVDHWINVDFCAFKGIVDAVGGVGVPFEFDARDRNTGLQIQGAPTCHTFQGDEALAYVRSRKYQYFDPSRNTWVSDGTSDLGRITRQQDFLKRTLAKALDRGARNVSVANDLMNVALETVITDSELTLDTMLQLATAMRNFDPVTVKSFQIEGSGMKQGDASVLAPRINSENMKNVLAVFRGAATILDIPEGLDPSLADPDVTTTVGIVTTVTTVLAGGSTTLPATPATTSTTVPATSAVLVAENDKGLSPPDDPSCR